LGLASVQPRERGQVVKGSAVDLMRVGLREFQPLFVDRTAEREGRPRPCSSGGRWRYQFGDIDAEGQGDVHQVAVAGIGPPVLDLDEPALGATDPLRQGDLAHAEPDAEPADAIAQRRTARALPSLPVLRTRSLLIHHASSPATIPA
jgi:hypothetical protein